MLAEAAEARPVAETADGVAEAHRCRSPKAEAHDEALLDMIAMEMGAPDPISDEEIAEAVAEQTRLQTTFAQPAWRSRAGRAKDCARTGRRAGAADSTGGSTVPAPRRRTSACACAGPCTPAPAAPTGMSLGSTHHRERHVAKAGRSANDPLAPIRRMSQAEKIAFFS